jgi:hypothetical protein
VVHNGNAVNIKKQTPNSATSQPTTSQDNGDTASKDPTGTALEDPTIFPKAGETANKSNTLEGYDAEISQDYAFSENGEDDNIIGKKELRNEGDNEDEKNSKRAKGPVNPYGRMRESHQPQHNSKETGHGQIATPDHLLDPSAPINQATTTTLPKPLITTIDPGLLITSTNASDVRKLKHFTLPIIHAHRIHLSARRLSHPNIARHIRKDKLQKKLREQLPPSLQHPFHATATAAPAKSSANNERHL